MVLVVCFSFINSNNMFLLKFIFDTAYSAKPVIFSSARESQSYPEKKVNFRIFDFFDE